MQHVQNQTYLHTLTPLRTFCTHVPCAVTGATSSFSLVLRTPIFNLFLYSISQSVSVILQVASPEFRSRLLMKNFDIRSWIQALCVLTASKRSIDGGRVATVKNIIRPWCWGVRASVVCMKWLSSCFYEICFSLDLSLCALYFCLLFISLYFSFSFCKMRVESPLSF